MSPRHRKPRKPVGGGGARHPNSLANLRPGATSAPPGNRRALRHGAYATITREALDAKAREIFEALAVDAPLRDPDGGLPAADALAVRLLAEALIRLDSVSEFLGRRGWETDDGTPRPAVEIEARLRKEAFEYAEALGMTPRSRAKLGLDVARTGTAIDLAMHWAEEDEETVEGDAEEVGDAPEA